MNAEGKSDGARWLDRFFEHYYRSNPVGATFVGEHAHDGRLPDYSEGALDDAKTRLTSLLAESTALEVGALDEAERHDVRIAQGALRIQQWELTGRHFHRGNPSLYTGEAAFGLISLFLTDYAPIAVRSGAAAERLAAMPRLFEQARASIQSAPLAWTERALRECAGIAALLDDGLPKLVADHGADPTMLSAIDEAKVALSALREYFESELSARPADDVSAGPEGFALHLSEGHFLSEDASEIERYARAELAEVTADLAGRAGDFGASTPIEVLAQLREHHPSAAAYETDYQRVWNESRALAEEKGLLSWPDFPIRYLPRPSWTRSAAPHLYFLFYRSPAAVHPPTIHDYLIASLDVTAPHEEQRRFLEANNDSVIKLNHVVHHGGIGHHVQNWHAFRSPSRIGRMAAVDCASRIALLSGGTMAEGWACYATDLMGESGFLTPLERYAERHGRVRMCARAIVDVRIHTGKWTLEHAAKFYEEHALMPPAAAMAEAVKNSMFPGAAVMYLTGRDAIHRLRSDMQGIWGRDFSMKRFHDTFLSYGSIPVSMVASAMKSAAIAYAPDPHA